MAFNIRRHVRESQGLPLPGDSTEEEEEVVVAAYAMGMLPISPMQSNPRYNVARVMVRRGIREGWQRLWTDYFSPEKVYPDAYFRRRCGRKCVYLHFFMLHPLDLFVYCH